jgi:tRNA pseudouridine55 synthase
MHGFISVNKPSGLSSFQATRITARALGIKKAGHAGTLDPFATGVLPIAVGEATKAVSYLHLAEKTYSATIRFGVLTDTLDMTGNVLETRDASFIDRKTLEDALPRFTGEIEQRPPVYSAIKIKGRRSYEAARSGEPSEPPPRKVFIRDIVLVGFAPPLAEIVVRCGQGTYIRSLARDLGDAVGSCASLHALVRTAYGPFVIASSCPPVEASPEMVTSIASALSHLAAVRIGTEAEKDIRNGVKPDAAFFRKHDLPPPDPRIEGIMTDVNGRLVSVFTVKADGDAKILRVFCEKNNLPGRKGS